MNWWEFIMTESITWAQGPVCCKRHSGALQKQCCIRCFSRSWWRQGDGAGRQRGLCHPLRWPSKHPWSTPLQGQERSTRIFHLILLIPGHYSVMGFQFLAELSHQNADHFHRKTTRLEEISHSPTCHNHQHSTSCKHNLAFPKNLMTKGRVKKNSKLSTFCGWGGGLTECR